MSTEEMMEIIRQNEFFSNSIIDHVIFGGIYPVLFTVFNNNSLFLFICHNYESENNIQWIVTKTTPLNIIYLLKNRISFRNAFIYGTNKKMILNYDGEKVSCDIKDLSSIPDEYLPTDGEYLNAEIGEYDDLLMYYNTLVIISKNTGIMRDPMPRRWSTRPNYAYIRRQRATFKRKNRKIISKKTDCNSLYEAKKNEYGLKKAKLSKK